MIEKKPSNTELVYDAIVNLHAAGEIVTRVTLSQVMDLKLSIIDDRLKELANDNLITRVQRGVYIPSETYPPARIISATVMYGDTGAIERKPSDSMFCLTRLPDGLVVIDVYDYVVKLIPSELRTMAKLLQPFAAGNLAASVIVIDIGDEVIKLSAVDAAEVAKMLAPYALDAYSLQVRDDNATAIMELERKVKELEVRGIPQAF